MMSKGDTVRRRVALLFWRLFNPIARALAGIAPWWVVLETTGRKSGKPRQAPLARGPVDGNVAWLIAVHGERSAFARNIAADPRVRLRLRGRWLEGTARLAPLDDDVVARFNAYARSGPRAIGIEPKLVRVELDRVP
jgi:deazaflavin-dependent oxidoreductase (nitroreductase family)